MHLRTLENILIDMNIGVKDVSSQLRHFVTAHDKSCQVKYMCGLHFLKKRFYRCKICEITVFAANEHPFATCKLRVFVHKIFDTPAHSASATSHENPLLLPSHFCRRLVGHR